MGGQASKTSLPPEFQKLEQYATSLLKRTSGARNMALDQLSEAMSTGGVKAKIPAIQQAVSAQNQATSNALSQTAQSLASRNIGGPFAARQLAQVQQSGAQTAAAIPTNMAQDLIKQFMPFLQGTQSLGFGGLAQAGQASFASDVFNAQQFAKAMEDVKSSLSGAGAAAACLHPSAKIDTPRGPVAVDELRPGDEVYSTAIDDTRIVAKVVMCGERHVGLDHVMAKIEGATGTFYVTPAHPDHQGNPIGYAATIFTPGTTDRTCDIEVDGPTGLYFVCGVLLRSTLDRRHAAKRAA